MPTQNINQSPPHEIYEQLKLLSKPYNQKFESLSELLKSVEAEGRNSYESRRRFSASIDALTAEVGGHNKSLRDSIKQGQIDAESARKTRAARAACLEDIEINKSLDKQAEISCELAELKADQVKTEIIQLKRSALNDAHAFLQEHLTRHMLEIHPIMLFIGITSELADAGWSSLYNELPNIHTGYEFAMARLVEVFNEALGRRAPKGFDSGVFICDLPVSNRFKGNSPLQAKARAEKIAAMEGEQ
jgi:hypothetical protein